MLANQRSGLRKLTLTASLAVIYRVFRAIPISSLIGISGSITAAGMIAPIIGILLEQDYGILAVFTGTMIEHLTGGLLFATVVGKGALKFWPVIFVAYPIERTILVVGATLICATLLSLLRPSVVEESLEAAEAVATSGVRSSAGPDK